jgi:hypothetical protein
VTSTEICQRFTRTDEYVVGVEVFDLKSRSARTLLVDVHGVLAFARVVEDEIYSLGG